MERISEPKSSYFDAWRGGSAIVVLIGHLHQIYVPQAAVHAPIYGALAGAAVMAFFGLSGFFIAKSLQSKDWRKFAVARADRLLPPFLLCLALCIALWAVAPFAFSTGTRAFAVPSARASFGLEGLLSTSLFLNGFWGQTLSSNGPLWSLSYEVWYYVLAALIVFRRTAAAIILGAVLTWLQPFFAIQGTIWIAGFVLGARGFTVPRASAWLWIIPAVLFCAVAFSPVRIRGAFTLFELSFGLCFVAHMSRVLAGSAPTIPVLPLTAKFSYTLYVTHFPIALFGYGMGAPVLLVGVTALAFAALVGIPLEGFRPTKFLPIRKFAGNADAARHVS